MAEYCEKKTTTTGYCYIAAAVYILFNAIVTFILIFYMVQQQQEIKNLRAQVNNNIVHHSSFSQFKLKQPTSLEDETQLNFNVITTNPKKLKKGDDEGSEDKANTLYRIKRNAGSTCCGKGRRGRKGHKGELGERGHTGFPGMQGPRGDRGRRGPKGDAGEKGDHGMKGSIGPPGPMASPQLLPEVYRQSAHISGIGGVGKQDLEKHTITNWVERHTSGMEYKDGYIKVNVEGFYYVYSQLYYYSRTSPFMGHDLNIDNSPILSGYSNDGAKKNLNTNYIGGVFHLKRDQRISVSTSYTLNFYFDSRSAYFGAFMAHPVSPV